MPIDLTQTSDGARDWLRAKPLARQVFGNPAVVAAMLTALAYILFVWLHKIGRVRGCVYFFLVATVVLFTHYAVSASAAEAVGGSEHVDFILSNMPHAPGKIVANSTMPVYEPVFAPEPPAHEDNL